MASATARLQPFGADVHGTNLGSLAATSCESGGRRRGKASGQVTARWRSAQVASVQRRFRQRRADGGWSGVLDSHQVVQKTVQRKRGSRTTRGRRRVVVGGNGICRDPQRKTEGCSDRRFWRTNYGNWVKFDVPVPREEAVKAVAVVSHQKDRAGAGVASEQEHSDTPVQTAAVLCGRGASDVTDTTQRDTGLARWGGGLQPAVGSAARCGVVVVKKVMLVVWSIMVSLVDWYVDGQRSWRQRFVLFFMLYVACWYIFSVLWNGIWVTSKCFGNKNNPFFG